MFRQSPRRNNQRSRGIKPKHAVQAIFLLCVCSLLVYQVQNSHGQTPFSHGTAKVSEKLQQYYTDNVKLGRKDPLPGTPHLEDLKSHRDEPDHSEHQTLETEEERENENKVKEEIEGDAEDIRNVVEMEQLFKDDEEGKSKSEGDDEKINTNNKLDASMEFASPAPSPTTNKNKNDKEGAAPSSSIKGYIEEAMKNFFGGFSDESGPDAAAPALKISEISAPSESYAPQSSFIDSTGDNGAPATFSQVMTSAESPLEAKPMHAFMLQGLE